MTQAIVRREVLEGPLPQGSEERVVYRLDTTPWGGSPAGVAVTVIDNTTNTDVTGSTTSGTPTVLGNVITLPAILDLVAGREYTVYVLFSSGSNIFEPYVRLICSR